MSVNIEFGGVEPNSIVLIKRKELVMQDCHGSDLSKW